VSRKYLAWIEKEALAAASCPLGFGCETPVRSSIRRVRSPFPWGRSSCGRVRSRVFEAKC